MPPDISKSPEDAGRQIRVLHVLGSLNRGGAETWVVQLMDQHRKSGHFQSDILIQSSSGPQGLEKEAALAGAKVISIKRDLLFPFRLFTLLCSKPRYDVIHSHRNEFSAVVLFVSWLARVPRRISHSHSDTTPNETKFRLAYRKVCRAILRKVATHRLGASRESVISLFGSNDADARVHYCGIKLSNYEFSSVRRSETRKALGLTQSTFTVGHIGSFRLPKNHQFLVNVFRELERSLTDTRLVLVGDGVLRDDTERLVETLGIQDKVIFTGLREDIPALLSAFDVFLFPSLYEGLGISLIEAQAAGLPVIMSSAVPPAAVVDSALATRVSLEEGPAAWVEVLLRHANMPSERDRSIKYPALSRFEIERSADGLADIYRGA